MEEFLNNKISSINDFSPEEADSITQNYFEKKRDIICSVLSYSDREYTLKNKKSCFCCGSISNVAQEDAKLCSTRFKYGSGVRNVPIEFVVLMESIMRKDTKEQGLFRKPANTVLKKECEALFFSSIDSESLDVEDLIKRLDVFDGIVLSSIFKQLFSRSYVSIFPAKFINLIKKVMILEDGNPKFVLSKFLIYNIPPINRSILESVLSFIILIHDIYSDKGIDYEGHLDIKGYGTIIMPNLFLGTEKNVTFRDLADLADYAVYLMLNIKELLDVNIEDKPNI